MFLSSLDFFFLQAYQLFSFFWFFFASLTFFSINVDLKSHCCNPEFLLFLWYFFIFPSFFVSTTYPPFYFDAWRDVTLCYPNDIQLAFALYVSLCMNSPPLFFILWWTSLFFSFPTSRLFSLINTYFFVYNNIIFPSHTLFPLLFWQSFNFSSLSLSINGIHSDDLSHRPSCRFWVKLFTSIQTVDFSTISVSSQLSKGWSGWWKVSGVRKKLNNVEWRRKEM